MMRYTTEKYSIDISSDSSFRESSTDDVNDCYFVYLDKGDFQVTSIFGVRIFEGNTLLKGAIIGSIGGGTGVHERSIVIENDRFLVCCSDTIFCMAIPDLTLLWRTKADLATCFGIYKYQETYLVHGELEISRLGRHGETLWQQGGSDIFTTPDGRDSFVITDNYILVTDWAYRKYKFNFDGQSIL